MRTTITIPQGQVDQIDRIAKRLGMRRLQCINYLVTLALSQEQFRGATSDTADGTLILARLAEREMEEYDKVMGNAPEKVPVLVTPGQRLKNETGKKSKERRTGT